MGVVAPVSRRRRGRDPPVVVGVRAGERPRPLVWLGMRLGGTRHLAGLPRARRRTPRRTGGSGAWTASWPGSGSACCSPRLGQIPDGAGFWPLVLNQAVGVVVVAIARACCGAVWVPREAARLVRAWSRACSARIATAAFLLATHHGLLSVSAVLTSLYPAFTVLLAALVLRERVHRVQACGLGLCGLAVVLVAMG